MILYHGSNIAITLAELVHELHYSQGITYQYFFGSQRAVEKLICLCP